VLDGAEMFWLSTVREDGRPHVVPMPAVWLDGMLHFCTGVAEQKAVNLRSNAQCVLSTGPNHFREGLDVVVEGSAARVTGRERFEPLAALWKSKLDWDFDVADDGFRDPHSFTGEVLVFGVAPAKVLAFGKSPYSQTRYRFAG
jgi:general stress protein 26